MLKRLPVPCYCVLARLQGAKSASVIRSDEDFLRYCSKSSAALSLLTRAVSTSQAVLQSRKGTPAFLRMTCCFPVYLSASPYGKSVCMRSKAWLAASMWLWLARLPPPASRARRSRRLRDTLAAVPGLLAHACLTKTVKPLSDGLVHSGSFSFCPLHA